ncbi:MAG TPA: dienelactone hydrolase, partial [Mesotoga sp.]|nr:dienelactone hydrolase [Mesotoga sp.]
MQRKLVLLLVILFSVLAVASVDIASQYINGLYEGRFEEIYQMQDETMKKAQPVTVLKNLKTQLDVQ